MAEKLTEQQKNDFAASFQKIAVETLVDKLEKATRKYQPTTVVIAGGVAANSVLRAELLRRVSDKVSDEIIFTAPEFCTDNAAMVATLGAFHAVLGRSEDPLTAEVYPSLSMENARW